MTYLECIECPIKIDFSLFPNLQNLGCDLDSILGLILPKKLGINGDTKKTKKSLVSLMQKEMKVETDFDKVLEQYHNFLYLGSKMEESREKIEKL